MIRDIVEIVHLTAPPEAKYDSCQHEQLISWINGGFFIDRSIELYDNQTDISRLD